MSTEMVARNATRLLLGLIVILLAVLIYTMTRPRPLPRILDEHGNNILYTCPGDPRCTPVTR
jgi:hypothetical protein